MQKFIQSHSVLNSPQQLLRCLEDYTNQIMLIGHVARETIKKFTQPKVWQNIEHNIQLVNARCVVVAHYSNYSLIFTV